MRKRTKTQKKRLARDLHTKARELFLEGLISDKQFSTVQKLSSLVLSKINR